jgi:large subunit ribosomal protein L3
MAQDPGRVFPGKRMSGHLGNVKCTTQNLEILRIDVERSLLLIKGSIPGAKGGDVVVCPSVKITRISAKPPVKSEGKAMAKSGTKSGKKAGA